MSTPLLFGLRVLAWRARPLLLAALVVLLALVVIRQLAPPAEATEPVVVAARAVPAGTDLTPADLEVARVPGRLVPDDAENESGPLVGRTIVVALPRGVAVVSSLLDDGRFGWTAPRGTVTVPVRLADAAVAGLLRPGDRIDLVAPGHDLDEVSPVVLARRALVLEVISAEDDGGLGSALGGFGSAPDNLTVVAVSPEEGHRLAGAGWGSLGAVLVEGS